MDLLETALEAVSETAQIEFKRRFDPGQAGEYLEIIKDIVAMANSGGGIILFGVDDNGAPVPDFDADTVLGIDPADITNKLHKYTGYNFHDFEIQQVRKDGIKLVAFVIHGVDTPMVFSKPGMYSTGNGKKQNRAFSSGTVYFRHGAKSEPAVRDDLQQLLEHAKQVARDELLKRIKIVAALPEGVPIQVNGVNGPIDTPAQLLQSAVRRREYNPKHLLSSEDLLWVFQQRHQLNITSEELRLLIGSALRRTATLYWWLQLMERKYNDDSIALSEVQKALEVKDRDTSDAGRAIAEVASIYADEETFEKIVSSLKKSDYVHFREAGSRFTSRSTTRSELLKRIEQAKHKGIPLLEMSIQSLEDAASRIAIEMINQGKLTTSNSKQLGNITRAIWYLNRQLRQQNIFSD